MQHFRSEEAEVCHRRLLNVNGQTAMVTHAPSPNRRLVNGMFYNVVLH